MPRLLPASVRAPSKVLLAAPFRVATSHFCTYPSTATRSRRSAFLVSPAVRIFQGAPCATPDSSSSLPSPLRHLSSSTSTPATSEAAAPSSSSAAPPDVCLLCDTHFTTWSEHCRDPAHVARTAICNYFVMPERSESLMQHLERHIALDLREVDALAAKKVERRRRRLLAGLQHLLEEGVLKDCLPGVAPLDENVTDTPSERRAKEGPHVNADRFLTRLLLGEAFMRREVIDRAARMVPTLTAGELNAVMSFLLSTRQLARIFDELSLQELVHAYAAKTRAAALQAQLAALNAKKTAGESSTRDGEAPSSAGAPLSGAAQRVDGASTNEGDAEAPRQVSSNDGEVKRVATSAALPDGAAPAAPLASVSASPALWRLSRDDKAAVLLACIGELEHFHRQDRPRSVLSKVAADALVLNVIATHARDNLLSELIHEALQRIIEEGSPVWRQHQSEVQLRLKLERELSQKSSKLKNSNNVGCAFNTTVGSGEGLRKAGSGAAKQNIVQPSSRVKDVDNLFHLMHVRKLPLSAVPIPFAASADSATASVSKSASAASPTRLFGKAAAEQLISSYVVFRDVDDVSPARSASPAATTSTTSHAAAVASLEMAARDHGDSCNLPLSPASLSPASVSGGSAVRDVVHMRGGTTVTPHWEEVETELTSRGQCYTSRGFVRPFPRLRVTSESPDLKDDGM